MRHRLAVVLALVCVLAAACRGSQGDSYWQKVDGLYQQASHVFTTAYGNPTPDSVVQLQGFRDQISALPHPSTADRYHELLVAELDAGVTVLSALRDHDAARAEPANQKLRELQKQVDEERRRVAPR